MNQNIIFILTPYLWYVLGVQKNVYNAVLLLNDKKKIKKP